MKIQNIALDSLSKCSSYVFWSHQITFLIFSDNSGSYFWYFLISKVYICDIFWSHRITFLVGIFCSISGPSTATNQSWRHDNVKLKKKLQENVNKEMWNKKCWNRKYLCQERLTERPWKGHIKEGIVRKDTEVSVSHVFAFDDMIDPDKPKSFKKKIEYDQKPFVQIWY